ncbi:MAG: lysophospholipid acyltransferase family protein [Planctomycetes bacterium]|nr:lysophospholipid acyltransferase family protein [Planctomycetota bacterium]
MATRRSFLKDYAVYLLVRFGVCLVQALSWEGALQLARGLAWLAYRVDRRHRQVALDNVRHAFAHLDAQAVDRLVRASYLHLTTMVVEMIRLPRVLHPGKVHDYIRYANSQEREWILALTNSGRPRLMVTGHFGNWEVLNYATGLDGFRGGVVARRLDNPFLNRFLLQFRRRTGLTLLDKAADYPRILEMLARGEALGMVGDQDAGPRGLFVNFFGRPASTFKSIALLSLEYQAPIVVFGAARVGQPMQYRLYFEDVILPEDYAGRADAPRAMTQRYSDALERMVRRHPEQYFWLHRRWKHQPQARKGKQAA